MLPETTWEKRFRFLVDVRQQFRQTVITVHADSGRQAAPSGWPPGIGVKRVADTRRVDCDNDLCINVKLLSARPRACPAAERFQFSRAAGIIDTWMIPGTNL